MILTVPWAWWVSGPGWSTAALLVAAIAAVPLYVIDLRTHRLPDVISLPMTGAVAVLLATAGLASGDLQALWRSMLGGAALGAAYLLLHVVNPSGLGFGDVKLALPLGMVTAWFGWPVLWGTAVLPFLIGGVVGLALIVTGRATRKTAIAFGPFMLAGAAVALTAARVLA
ncbi:prepilin peptidase [Isoptericola chiayiensis]|nr:A24 family peptidase [Isoptericola chiayiensis]NOW02073.1 leader peptidase (prepilin peptidase)/N-methyltransferase [Isoptericola chiayiensis]